MNVLLSTLLRAHGLVEVDVEEYVLVDLGQLLVEFSFGVYSIITLALE